MSKKNISNTAIVIFIFTFLVRVLTVLIIGKSPCMEEGYFTEANHLFSDSLKIDIYTPPAYSILLYFLNLIFNNPMISSWVVYIVFSSLTTIIVYVFVKKIFDEKTAITAILIMIFLPNITVAVADYSHTMTVGCFFMLTSFYILWVSVDKNIFHPLQFIALTLAMIAATFIRPENFLILSLTVSIIIIFCINKKKYKAIIMPVACLLFLLTAVITHGKYISERSNSNYNNAFSSSEYSYLTFTHTLSMRAGKGIVNEIAIDLGTKAFGSPESNKYSILSAIFKNKKEEFKNLIFNSKELIDHFAHPLFFPFFMYFFIGLGVMKFWLSGRTDVLLYLIFISSISIIPMMIFHVEIRYMMPLVFPFIILCAAGIENIEYVKVRQIVRMFIVALLFIIYVSYLYINAAMDSLCG